MGPNLQVILKSRLQGVLKHLVFWGLFPSLWISSQSLGLSSSHDRALVKRKLKELAAAAEKERKAQEKTARQREKLRRREHEAKKS